MCSFRKIKGEKIIAELPLGFRAKISRAKEHLDALKSSTSPFKVCGEAYSVVKEANRQTGQYIFRIKVGNEPPLVQWSLMIGDCLHNARSALDHLFWALVIKQNPVGVSSNDSRKANFPIFRDPATFRGKKDLQQWVGEDAFTLLERLQPYNVPKEWNHSPLMLLHDFDITDKHKLLLPTMHAVDSGEIRTQTVDNRDTVFDGHATLMAFENNSVIAHLTYRTPQDVVDVDYSSTFDVIFEGQPGPMRVVPTLERLIEVVEEIGEDFRSIL